ncbi:MAG: GntR family transcriptional regulator [Phycisphaerae bacterium]
MSYKFQRLRERIRKAIETGELQNRLPGERELARRFQVNAKTVNKALRDLSREGLLVRHIGLGTFVSNGASVRTGRHRVFRYFSSNGPLPSDYRHSLITALRREVTRRGHGLEEISLTPARGSVPIRMADWPSSLRRKTDGLFCVTGGFPEGAQDRFSEELLFETARRQVPIVRVGAPEESCKVNAVVPDYVDAGYRLTEHALRMGCKTQLVVDAGAGRAVEAIRSGCRTASARYGGRLRENTATPCGGETADWLERECTAAMSSFVGSGETPSIGVLLVGPVALSVALANDSLMRRQRAGEIAITCVADQIHPAIVDLGITTYEVEVERITSWAARLMIDHIMGQRPIELLVPGSVKIRGDNPIRPGLTFESSTGDSAEASTGGEVLAEVMI